VTGKAWCRHFPACTAVSPTDLPDLDEAPISEADGEGSESDDVEVPHVPSSLGANFIPLLEDKLEGVGGKGEDNDDSDDGEDSLHTLAQQGSRSLAAKAKHRATLAIAESAALSKQEQTAAKAQQVMGDLLKEAHDLPEHVPDILRYLVLAVRKICAWYNSSFARKGSDRVAGRFAEAELRERAAYTGEDDQYYEDEDMIAVLCDVDHGSLHAEYAMIEKVVVREKGRTGKERLENVALVHKDDPRGLCRVRWFDPVKPARPSGSTQLRTGGRLAFTLPVCSQHGPNWVIDTSAIIGTVTLTQHHQSGHFLLDLEDEKFVMDFLHAEQGTSSSKSGRLAPKPKSTKANWSKRKARGS